MTLVVAALLASLTGLLLSGCTQLRLPQIDPTGSRLFAPYPQNSTTLDPSCGCLGCVSGESCCLTNNPFSCLPCLSCLSGDGCCCGLGCCLGSGLPEPAFQEPAPPPPCATPAPAGTPTATPSICLPAPGCEDCFDGPPAVLLGCESRMADLARLPKRGKRGCILLSPQRIVAPVGGEVLLLSGVCGNDGYLVQREPLEWMLTPESVGHIIQVGDDDPGLLHRLAKTPVADKRSGSFARGVTSTKETLITRGNKDLRDDVRLEKGQTWISVSSPTEGTSRVTVLAPESDCWDQRKATATIYWIDAQWQFPAPQVLAAGTSTFLTTRVTRSEGAIPAEGWIVQYEVLNPELASLAPTGSSVAEVKVDASGNATVEVVPTPGTGGTAMVAVTVIRPADPASNMPRMTLGQGQAPITWSSPQLTVRAGAPQVAGFDAPFTVACDVANPGNMAAENVSVTLELPPGVAVESKDSFARVIGNQLIWEIDRIPAQQQWGIQATLTSRAPVTLRFQARADNGLFAEDAVQVDVFRPALSVKIQPVLGPDERPRVGDEVTFNIDVTNTGDRALDDLKLESLGDGSMMHLQTGVAQAFKDKENGPLQPGQSWSVATTYVPTAPGERCLTVNATAAGGQRASERSCITVLNPTPPTPAVNARIESLPTWAAGDDNVLFKYRITNTGREVLRKVQVTASYDPQLVVLQATVGMDESELPQYKLKWVIPEIAPGAQTLVEARFRAVQPNPQSLMVLSVESEKGATAADDFRFAIVPGAAPQPPSRAVPPPLPPAGPPPAIPPAPPASATPNTPPPNTPPPNLSPSDRNIAPPIAADNGTLRLRLIGLDNPAEVGSPIRFQLIVTNDRSIPDSQVELRFELPNGTNIQSVSQTMNPGGEQFRQYAGMINLNEIRQLMPGESVTYTIVLVSNQPQQIALEVQARSRLNPQGVSAVERITVLPR